MQRFQARQRIWEAMPQMKSEQLWQQVRGMLTLPAHCAPCMHSQSWMEALLSFVSIAAKVNLPILMEQGQLLLLACI